MISRKVTPTLASLFALSLLAFVIVTASVSPAQAQSSRPRRVKPAPSPTPDSLLGPEPKPSPIANNNAPLLDVKPSKPVGNAPASTDTTHAFQLFQQKEYAAAAREAKAIATADPGNAEAWKLAGFSEFYLKQYNEAADDLQKALDLNDVLIKKTRTPLMLSRRAILSPKNSIALCRCWLQ